MDRLEKLRELETELREMMAVSSTRTYAALARQYRETLREIDMLENGEDGDDALAALILRHREPAPDA